MDRVTDRFLGDAIELIDDRLSFRNYERARNLELEPNARIKGGESPNGCFLCNTIAELGSHTDKRIKLVLETYLKLQEGYFHAALLRAKELREIPEEVDVRGHAKLLVGYTTGILGTAKVLSEKEMRRSVRATIAAIK